MDKKLPRRDWFVLITVFLALGGIGMMFIFSFLIGFGIHSTVGKISLYVCFALQMLNVLTMLLRRLSLEHRRNTPRPSKKMRKYLIFSLSLWALGALNLIFSLVCYLFWYKAIDSIVYYPCIIGTIIAPLGWVLMLAGFHRRREAAILTN